MAGGRSNQEPAGKKRAKKKRGNGHNRDVEARIAGNTIRQGGRKVRQGIMRVGEPRPGPIARHRNPVFEHQRRSHKLKFRLIEGRKAFWRCSCGTELVVEHRAREDAGERAALDQHCRDLVGKSLDKVEVEEARARRQQERSGRPRRPLGGQPAGRSKNRRMASPQSQPKPTARAVPKPLAWQKSRPGRAPALPPVRLCDACGTNELNCRC